MQTEQTACAKALGQEGGRCVRWSAESEWLDLRVQEAGCGVRRLGREPGSRPHQMVPWMELRGQEGAGASASCHDPFGKACLLGSPGAGALVGKGDEPQPGAGAVPAARVRSHGSASTRRGRAWTGEIEIPHPGSPV